MKKTEQSSFEDESQRLPPRTLQGFSADFPAQKTVAAQAVLGVQDCSADTSAVGLGKDSPFHSFPFTAAKRLRMR